LSACAYAFLGGVDRQVSENEEYGVHQFYREDALSQPTTPVLSAKDYAEAQRLQSELFEYVEAMSADPRLVSLASSAPPWGQMRYLDRNELKDLKVVSTSLLGPKWSLEPGGADGLLAGITRTQRGEMFKLIVQCTQGSNLAQLVVVDYNKYLRENVATLNSMTTEAKIKIQSENTEIAFGRVWGIGSTLL
jgi:hypothetical protein